MESLDFLQYIIQVIFWLVEIVICIACALLVYRERSIASILMLVGSILTFVISISRTILFALPSLTDDMETYMTYNYFISIANSLSYGIFGLGLLIFAINYKKSNQRVA